LPWRLRSICDKILTQQSRHHWRNVRAAMHLATGAARSAHALDLHLGRDLPCGGRRRRHYYAILQFRHHGAPSRGDIAGSGAGCSCNARRRSVGLTHQCQALAAVSTSRSPELDQIFVARLSIAAAPGIFDLPGFGEIDADIFDVGFAQHSCLKECD
jgi:hypothetical protein